MELEKRKLVGLRGQTKGSISKILNLLKDDSKKKELSTTQLLTKRARLVELFKDYCELNAKVKAIDDQDTENFDTVEDNYLEGLDIFDTIISTNSKGENLQLKAKLPPITIKTFTGKVNDICYYSFINLFDSAIHSNITLSNCDKMHFLLSHLEGEALDVVKHLYITNENYITARQLLKDRYDNKPAVINHHITAILDLASISKCTASALREMVTIVKQHLGALHNFNVPVKEWDLVVIAILQKKLDNFTLRNYHLETKTTNKLPTLAYFLNFLEQRAAALETTENPKGYNVRERALVAVPLSSQQIQKCKFCLSSPIHKLHECAKFKLAPLKSRNLFVKQNKLCIICLRFHADKCRYSFRCVICKGNHNTLLHEGSAHTSAALVQDSTIPNNEVSLVANNVSKFVLLPTVKVRLLDKFGNDIIIRGVLDSGSQVSLILHNIVSNINCNLKNNYSQLTGIGHGELHPNYKTSIDIRSFSNNFKFTVDCLVVDNITCDIPQQNINAYNFKIPADIELADPDFYKSEQISLLLGSDVFFNLLQQDRMSIINENLFLQATKLGYVLVGNLSTDKYNNTPVLKNVVSYLTMYEENKSLIKKDSEIVEINDLLSKFWSCEDVPHVFTEAETEYDLAEQIFSQSVTLQNNRFAVALPLKQTLAKINIGNSFSYALKRFYNLEKRFQRDPQLFYKYKQFIDEYIQLGHAKVIDISELDINNKPYYILAHHPIFNPQSPTTALRVVFDGSMQTEKGVSLNDYMLNGKNVQNDLFNILVLFRLYKFTLICDIKKMFRQVLIHPQYCCLQNILWRDNKDENITCIQLKTVTYGQKSSTFLATRCLYELATKYKQMYPLGAKALLQYTYVDDVNIGSNNLSELLEIKRQLIEILNLGGFEPHKWNTNDSNLAKNKNENVASSEIDLCKNVSEPWVRSLGIIYNFDTDKLVIKAPKQEILQFYTKKQLVSFVGRLFDPMGLVSPIILQGKYFMQQAAISKVPWDEKVPKELNEEFKKFALSLVNMPDIQIDRHLNLSNIKVAEIVGFCDASTKAYGCCLYLRTISFIDQVNVNLICSKTRVCPITQLSIPKLELNSALLLADLASKVFNLYKDEINNLNVYLYSDSKIVLAWLNTNPCKLKVYVANRVRKIIDSTSEFYWDYVGTADNPADYLSRGVEPHKLQSITTWWHGPQFLHDILFPHTKKDNSFIQPNVPEMSINIACNDLDSIIQRYSDVNKIKRVLARIMRFYNNCRKKKGYRDDSYHLLPSELNNALNIAIRCEQQTYFCNEITAIKSNKKYKGNLKALNPFLDNMQILRVGGRLTNADLPYENRHQIILPKHSKITSDIILNTHIKMLHSGKRLTLATLHEKYYLIDGLRQVSNVINKCVICFKLKAKCAEQLMGSLPKERIQQRHVFDTVGIDYGGPFSVKLKRIRKPIIYKAYLVLFVCFVTKAIHLELVSDMTTECFLAALKRFIARRNKPSHIFCDNASTFKGANNTLHKLFLLQSNETHQSTIINYTANLGITFKFIPSYSPMFGGLWEAGIKSAKSLLKRVVGNVVLTFEELNTVFIEIEGVLNSRPLTALSTDPSDLSYLSPGHFLTGRSLASIPEPSLVDSIPNRLSFWRQCTQMVQSYWKHWHKYYLNLLQNRPKWKDELKNIKEGTLVILRQDNIPPLQWPMARVIKLYPGLDGKVRAVDVKMANNFVLRTSISKVCILPIDQ